MQNEDMHKLNIPTFLAVFGWLTAFNPQWVAIALSCVASIYASLAYRSTWKKNQKDLKDK